MASQNRSWSTLFLALILYHYSFATPNVVLAANEALLDQICKLSQDYQFCRTIFRNDRRTGQADLRGLAVLSIAITIDVLQDVSDRLPQISVPSNPIAQQRKKACQTDYLDALTSYHKAFEICSKGDYLGVIDLLRVGTNKAIDCENIYKRDPISVSPVSTENHNVIKLSEITLIVIDMILRH